MGKDFKIETRRGENFLVKRLQTYKSIFYNHMKKISLKKPGRLSPKRAERKLGMNCWEQMKLCKRSERTTVTRQCGKASRRLMKNQTLRFKCSIEIVQIRSDYNFSGKISENVNLY